MKNKFCYHCGQKMTPVWKGRFDVNTGKKEENFLCVNPDCMVGKMMKCKLETGHKFPMFSSRCKFCGSEKSYDARLGNIPWQ